MSITQCCPDAITFFGALEKLFIIFSRSPQRWEILQDKIDMCLHRLSETRWSTRVKCVKPFASRIHKFCDALIRILALHLTAKTHSDAKGLMRYCISFKCIFMVSLWWKILCSIELRNFIMQARQINLDVELNQIHMLIEEMMDLRGKFDAI